MLGTGLTLASCRVRPDRLVDCDFEQFDGWTTSPPAGFTTEQVHLGHYAIKAESGREFAASYTRKLGAGLAYVPRHLRLSAWVYLPDGRVRSSILVLEVAPRDGRAGGGVWTGMNLDQVVKRYGQWEYVQRVVDLPADLSAEDTLKFYIWHAEAGGTSFYLDDIRIEAWP